MATKAHPKPLLIAMVLSAGLAAAGCAGENYFEPKGEAPTRVAPTDADLVQENYRAADALLARAPWLKDSYAPLLYGSFVNVNAMEDSSALGRIMSEQIGSRFAQKGYTVIDMKLRNNVFIKQGGDEGEFVLSRSVKELAQNHNASAIIAGTYAVGRRSVYVSARLIRAADSVVLASYDYNLPLGPDTKALVASE
ncbi:MAG TPA: FlgO family outer membrane protein [Candidatus Competibacteraceae bacterium]|nr:FlgO family outer membrane protein [Candidatus Competibacteraceae bacterium]